MAQNGYIKSLDGLRFVAVSLVLLDHWTNYKLGFPASYLGVSLFFVLSGYLITGILLKAKTQDIAKNQSHSRSLKLFYIRRTIRIFPVYYLVLFVLYLLNEANVREHIFWLLTYQTNNYIAYTGNWMGSFDHFWSLAVEEQFYLFFPFVIFFVKNKQIPKVLIGLILVSVALRLYFFVNHHSWVRPFVLMPTALDALGLGSLLAFYFQNNPKIALWSNQKLKLWLLATFLIYCVVVFLLSTQSEPHNFYSVVLLRFFESLFSLFLIFSFIKINDGSLFSKIKKLVFENDIVVYIGKISYGIYVYHHFVYNFYYTSEANYITKIFNKLNYFSPGLGENLFVRIGVLFPLVVLVASVSWYLFEKPINNLKEKFKY